MMTSSERQAKRILSRLLKEQGYKTYSNIFDMFDLNITSNPSVAAYMVPSKGLIVINKTLNRDQISTIIRHEILHEYLNHSVRLLKKLNAPSLKLSDYKEVATDPGDVTFADLEKIGYNPTSANIAMDYEISNRGYTEEDKDIIRNLELCGKTVRGLVTEDDHADWVNYTMEEMYDELTKQMQQDKKLLSQRPEEIDSDDEDDNNQNGNTSNDIVDEYYVYGTYDEVTGDFYDDDGNVVDYVDTYQESLSLEEALFSLNEDNLGRIYKYVDRVTKDVYKRNPDGSYTKVGNLNDKKPPQPPVDSNQPQPPQPRVNKINPPVNKNKNKDNQQQSSPSQKNNPDSSDDETDNDSYQDNDSQEDSEQSNNKQSSKQDNQQKQSQKSGKGTQQDSNSSDKDGDDEEDQSKSSGSGNQKSFLRGKLIDSKTFVTNTGEIVRL